jgi:hypothetical protein
LKIKHTKVIGIWVNEIGNHSEQVKAKGFVVAKPLLTTPFLKRKLVII